MSTSAAAEKFAEMRFSLDDDEPLGATYDADGDVLYLWRGETPQPGVSIETEHGHLLRLAFETGELIGITIFGWYSNWSDADTIPLTLPTRKSESGRTAQREDHRVLVAS